MSAISSLLSLLSFYNKSGPALVDQSDLTSMAKWLLSAASGITAHAGGGQANAVALTAAFNEVDTVATIGDSVMLPAAIPALTVVVNNNGANQLQVFGVASNTQNAGAGDTIAATNSTVQQPTATGVSQNSGFAARYVCTKVGQWKQFLSA